MLNGRLLRRKFSATAIDGDGNARQTLWIASKPSTMAVASHRLIHDPIPIMRTATVDGVLSDWKMTEGLSGGSVHGGPSRIVVIVLLSHRQFLEAMSVFDERNATAWLTGD
jgi:hypothetical protein